MPEPRETAGPEKKRRCTLKMNPDQCLKARSAPAWQMPTSGRCVAGAGVGLRRRLRARVLLLLSRW